jgi:NAD-dependent DNA ligase
VSTLKELDGFGESKVNNLIFQINKSKKTPISNFIKRLGIDLVGVRAVDNLGIKSKEDFLNFNDDSKVVGKNLIDFRDNNIDFITSLLDIIDIESVKEKSSKGKVCMTGKGHKGRKELLSDIESLGYEFSNNISKDISFLICENPDGGSSKLKKAKNLGIKLISYNEFFDA